VTFGGLALKNVARNRFRALLTVSGVAVAIITFVLLRTVVWAWTSGADAAAKDRVVTRHKVTFVMTLPKRYMDDVVAVPHVRLATFANWFGGKDPKHDKEFFAALAVDAKTFFDVYSEMSVPKDKLEAWKADRKGAIVGDVLAKKLGWKVGDSINLESGIYGAGPGSSAGNAPMPWQFTIDGIYEATAKSVDRSTFVFHWDYLNDTVPDRRKDQIGWIVSRVDNPSAAADVGVAIDKVFDVKDTQTLSQDERAFNTSFLAGVSAILTAVDWISVVILVIMMLILGNTIAMGVRERTNEYGVLRALGFLPKHLVGFILGEAMLIGGAGGVLGVLLSYPVVEQGLGRWLEENMGSFFPYFRIQASIALVAVGLAVVLGAVAAAIPAYRTAKLHVTDALRRVA
jgi:putative ABC transport system permease protein